MCLNCGCGEPDTRHQPTDITREDVERAAEGGGLSVDQAVANLSDSLSKLDTANATNRAGAASS
jgi:hypothetical protein